MTTKPSGSLSMRDRLSHLSFDEACKLLGPDGKRLLIRGGSLELPSTDALRIDDGEARVEWKPGPRGLWSRIFFDGERRGRLRAECSSCTSTCVHVGGLLSLLLEQKTDLGLAAPPPEVLRPASEQHLVTQALAERAERAKKERMKIRSADPSVPWTDYEVMSAISGKTYRVALRGEARGESYCACPDFKTNTLAGSSGLNLQAANTVINVDLPWNPAVLEQRIARAHRMGQTRPVHVFVLVTEQTLEENLLTTLSAKRDLAMAALDPDSKVENVDVRTQTEDIKERLEVLLGAKPEAPIDETVKEAAARAASAERLAQTGSTFLRAAFDLLGEIAGGDDVAKRDALASDLRATFDAKVVDDEHGKRRLSVAMPSRDTLSTLLRGIAGLLGGARGDGVGRLYRRRQRQRQRQGVAPNRPY